MRIKNNSELTHLKSSPSAYFVFIAIWGIPTVIWLLTYFINGRVDWQPIAICLIGLFGSIMWLVSFELILTTDQLIYRSLFGGTVTLLLKEIKKVEILTGCFTFSDRLKPTTRLVIEPQTSSNKKPIIINVKIFSQNNISHFYSELDKALVSFKSVRIVKN